MSKEEAITVKQPASKSVAAAETSKPKKAVTATKTKAVAAEKAVAKPKVAAAKTTTKKAAATSKKAAGAVKAEVAPAKTPAKRAAKAVAATETVKPKKAAAPKSAAGTRTKSAVVGKPSAPSSDERQRWIATAAYHRAERRGFAPGYEMQDWLDAEAEIDGLIGKA